MMRKHTNYNYNKIYPVIPSPEDEIATAPPAYDAECNAVIPISNPSSQPSAVRQSTNTRPVFLSTNATINPEPYHGTTDVADWLDSFSIISNANSWADPVKARKLPCFLQGSALKWYLNFMKSRLVAVDPTWDELKAALSTAFSSVNSALGDFNRMIARTQKLNESAMIYVYDKLSLLNKVANNMNEATKVAHLLNGLLPGMFEKIWIHQPDTVAELIEHIKLIDESHVLANTRHQITTSMLVAQTPIPKVEDLCLLVNQSNLDDRRQRRQEIERGQRKIVCYYCQKEGHIKAKCFKRAREQGERSGRGRVYRGNGQNYGSGYQGRYNNSRDTDQQQQGYSKN